MYNLYNGLYIGYNEIFKNEEFSGSDNKELYYENLRMMPDDWYYRDIKITYKRNSWGHRSKEYVDVDKNNYILSVGCSLTEGIGLELEKTYTHVLAEKLNCDYYNMGLGGSGIDVMSHNLKLWMATMPNKPKLIIVQWPYWGRFVHFDLPPTSNDINTNMLFPAASHSPNRDVTRILSSSEEINYLETVETLAKIQIDALCRYSYGIPTIHTGLSYGNRAPQKFDHTFIDMTRIDNARDNHFGIKSHESLASKIYDEVTKDL